MCPTKKCTHYKSDVSKKKNLYKPLLTYTPTKVKIVLTIINVTSNLSTFVYQQKLLNGYEPSYILPTFQLFDFSYEIIRVQLLILFQIFEFCDVYFTNILILCTITKSYIYT